MYSFIIESNIRIENWTLYIKTFNPIKKISNAKALIQLKTSPVLICWYFFRPLYARKFFWMTMAAARMRHLN